MGALGTNGLMSLTGLYLHTLKTSEHHKCPDVFWVYRKILDDMKLDNATMKFFFLFSLKELLLYGTYLLPS